MLIASSITGDSEECNGLSFFVFLEITTFSGNTTRSPTLSTIASWQRHTCKSSTAHSLGNTVLEAVYINTQHPVLCRRKEFAYTFDNLGVPIWPLAALSLAIRYCEISFFDALCNASAIIGLS